MPKCMNKDVVVAVQSPSRVQLFVTPWTAARQASLSFTISRSLPKFMSIESVMPSNHLTLCHPRLLLPSVFPSIRVFSNDQLFGSDGPSIRALASTSVLPKSIQGLFPLRLTGLISLLFKGLSRVFASTTDAMRTDQKTWCLLDSLDSHLGCVSC